MFVIGAIIVIHTPLIRANNYGIYAAKRRGQLAWPAYRDAATAQIGAECRSFSRVSIVRARRRWMVNPFPVLSGPIVSDTFHVNRFLGVTAIRPVERAAESTLLADSFNTRHLAASFPPVINRPTESNPAIAYFANTTTSTTTRK